MALPTQSSTAENLSDQSQKASKPTVIMGLDYGTVNTSIAFRLSTWGADHKYEILSSFPGDPYANLGNRQLPSVIAYSNNASKETLIGYEVQKLFAKPLNHPARAAYPNELFLERGKLLLYQSPHTEEARTDLLQKLKLLRRSGTIEEDHDVICDFLTACFKHVKSVLYSNYGVDNSCNVEIAFCVPAIGTPTSNLIMSMCVRKAMQNADFGTGGAIPYNIFMVNEAEAAALYVVESSFHDIQARQTIVNVDSGGGTTEGAVNIISHGYPLRLNREVVAAQGIMCGGTDVNQEFRMQLQKDFNKRDCHVSIEPGWTKSDLIEACVRKFDMQKLNFIDEASSATYEFHVANLVKSDQNPRLTTGYYVLSSEEMGKMFGRVVRKVESLMVRLLDMARAASPEVHKLVLTGGFGDSPYLRNSLSRTLREYNEEHSSNIDFIVAPSQQSATSTAIGTLLRAINKEHGPERALRMSVGVVRDIPYQKAAYTPEVNDQKLTRGGNGRMYISDVIQWFLRRGDAFQRSYKHTYLSTHLFLEDKEEWIAREELIMHPTATESFFKLDNPRNKGYISAGVAEFNLTHLKARIMEVQKPKTVRNRQIWEIDLNVCVEVNDVDIQLTAFHKEPSDTAPVAIPGFRICQNVRSLLDPGAEI